MNRRGFLASCLALGAAPAIVRADSLMRIVPVETTILPASWIEQQIGARMVLVRELVAYQVIRGGNKDVIKPVYRSRIWRSTSLMLKGIE
jgi:hypothetical protein